MALNKKKIIIIGPAHPYRGGIAALNERLASQLIQEGNDVTIYNFTVQYPSILFPGKTQYTDSDPISGLDIQRKINSVNPLNWLAVGNELKKQKPDLIIVRYWLPFMAPALGTICRKARKNNHTKVVALVDNIIPHEKRLGDVSLTKYFTHSVDGFIAMSDVVFDDISKFIDEPKKRFSPHPIYDHYGEILDREEALKALQLDPSYNYLLFFGFIRDYKGLDLLLQAMANPRLRKRNIKLIVAGEFYSDPKYYHDIIEKFGLKDDVILHTEYIPNEAINQYFGAADLVVQPYKTATQSGVTQIGYHFNKAMLVTDVGGLAEIIAHQKSGYVVQPDELAISNAIVDFFNNERKADFEEEVIEQKKKFSWERMTSTIDELFNSL
ncbi:glycosyltransferase [Prolixibacteraceae bacterium JC049]|nr:glycosyltransferase [Prolixibacteraceae bacterium JC049]